LQISEKQIKMQQFLIIILLLGGTFGCLEELDETLTITCSNTNSIQEISYKYKNQTYDQFLQITNSRITTLHPNELSRFSTIVKLFLRQLHIREVLPGAFDGLSTLKELYLDGNELTLVKKGVFNSLQVLEVLNLGNNQILRFEQMALAGASSLAKLDLRNNNISSIDSDFFNRMTILMYLDLSGNPLEKLPMKDLTYINTLNLQQTAVNRLDEDLSQNNLTFGVFNLSSNHISRVDFSLFPSAYTLDLSHCNVVLMENCQDLDSVYLYLAENRITTIQGGFKGLRHLDLRDNRLRSVTNSLLRQSPQITHVDLAYNSIAIIEKKAFENLTQLVFLDLSCNDITSLDLALFKDLTNLQVLNVSRNNIKQIKFGTFNQLTKLITLDISHNYLTEMDPYTFSSLSDLEYLNFDNNRISSFRSNEFNNNLPSLETISFRGNLWRCKELIRMTSFFKSLKINVIAGTTFNSDNHRGIPCSQEKHLNYSDSSGKLPAADLQKIINEAVKDSDLARFLNEDFDKSNFAEFFQKEYKETGFFQFLKEFREARSETAQRLISSQDLSNLEGSNILILSVGLQIVMCCLLLLAVYSILALLRQNRVTYGATRWSRVELS
jgi:Leucine-rich repeat (LRR) protein